MEKISLKLKLGYGFGGVGKDMGYALVGSFLMFYCTEYLGVSSVFMGVLYFVARIWDAVNDPMMGTIVDNTKIKFGRYRIWILVGTLSKAIVIELLFNSTLAAGIVSNKIYTSCYIAFLYIVWGMTYTMVDVPYWSFNANVTDDREQRNSVAVFPRIFSGLGNIMTQMLTITAVSALSRHSTRIVDKSNGFFKWAVIVACIYIFTILVSVFSIKERNVAVNTNERTSFRKAFNILRKNDQLIWVIVSFVLINLGMNCATGVAIYYFKYVWSNENLYSMFAAFIGGSMGLGLVIYPFVCKRFSRKGLFVFSTVMPAAGFVLMFVISFFFKEYGFAFYAFSATAILFCIGFGFLNVLLTVIIADCVDYDEWIRGRRNESVVFSMQTFLVKFATALSGLITGIGLKLGGYTGNSFASGTVQMAAIPASLNVALNIMMFALPPIFFLSACLILVKKFKLFDNKFMEKIVNEIVLKREGGEQ